LREQRVGPDPEPLRDLVLEQPVDDDDVGAEQLLVAGDPLADRDAVVADELEVEVRDPQAGVARAGRGLADIPAPAAEPEVASSVPAGANTNAASPSSLASLNVGRSAVTTVPTRSARMSWAWSSSTPAR
jgi:hypothetical protein